MSRLRVAASQLLKYVAHPQSKFLTDYFNAFYFILARVSNLNLGEGQVRKIKLVTKSIV